MGLFHFFCLNSTVISLFIVPLYSYEIIIYDVSGFNVGLRDLRTQLERNFNLFQPPSHEDEEGNLFPHETQEVASSGLYETVSHWQFGQRSIRSERSIM